MTDLASTSSALLSSKAPAPTVSVVDATVVFTPGAAPVDGEPPMTKSRMKKLAKQERLKARNLERKARTKEKRAELKAKRDAGELPADALPPRKKRKVGPSGKPIPFNARIVIDLGFDDLMNQKECISLAAQLSYLYAANRRSLNPFSELLCTSLNGKTHARLESLADAAYKRWSRTEWWTEPLEHLWAPDDADAAEPRKTKATQETVVYLTADTEDDILELKEGETYVLGGIVDRNRYKSLCYNKAKSLNVRTARLPIGKFVANLPTRKVLTVNQCYDILLHWVEHRDWEKAFYAVIPARKFTAKPGDSAEQEDEADDGELDGAPEGDDDERNDARDEREDEDEDADHAESDRS